MGCSCFGAGVLNIPLPNGLVPQAPVHTDSVTVYSTELAPTTLQDGTSLNEPRVIATEVKEQRLSSLIMGLALLGTMTGPLLIVLHTIPRGLFGGVFFVVGYGGLEGSGITTKLLYLMREPRFVPSNDPLLSVPKKQIVKYVGWQALGIASTVAISQTIAAIGFPVLIIALIPLRWMVLPRLFEARELRVLDAPTATSEVVLASMGGRPRMPEDRHEEEMGSGGGNEAVVMASGSGSGSGSVGSRTVRGEGNGAEKREQRSTDGDKEKEVEEGSNV